MHKKVLFFCSEGLPYIIGLLFISLMASVLTLFQPNILLVVFDFLLWVLLLEFFYFFRDPDRFIPQEPRVIVAPADGKIINIQGMKEESFLKGEYVRVSIFMNIFSVHVNRAPISGQIEYVKYHPGKFISAFKEKASLDNEQVLIGINGGEDKREFKVLVKLIAGLIARRIVLWKGEGDKLSKGERISLIKFGSRVDLYVPSGVELKVKEGNWVKAGETVIGLIL